MVRANAVAIFDRNAQEYDRWFDENNELYMAEVETLREFMPVSQRGVGLEVGVGTGRFAVPCGVRIGVEPAGGMAQIAKKRGILVLQAVGERMPFRNDQFDFALLVTVICFVRDVPRLLRETRRVLKKGGEIIIGFIDRHSPLGQYYHRHKKSHKFYQEANFYSSEEVIDLLKEAGFKGCDFRQTAFGRKGYELGVEEIRHGYGEGGFVAVKARKID